MKWKLKAFVQNVIARLPRELSMWTYYRLQRHFGGLRHVDPSSRLVAGVETWERIRRQGCSPVGKVFLEVGTGWVPLVPLAYWLMGAERTVTIDVNKYLREELVAEHLRKIVEKKGDIQRLFGGRLDLKRFGLLQQFASKPKISVADFLSLCQIVYVAPGDAAKVDLPARSIDFHTSYTVFEHIAPQILRDILVEGNRLLRNGGLFVHRIDYSDHFSHSDRSITAINFLQYSDHEWARYAGNRYMYMNRMRHDDYVMLFGEVGHEILSLEPEVDQRSAALLAGKAILLDQKFHGKGNYILGIRDCWFVTKQKGGG